MTQSPFTRSSPSSPSFTSTPFTAGPTVSILILSGRFALIKGLDSVCPYPCNIFIPSAKKKLPISGLRAAPPETNALKFPPSWSLIFFLMKLPYE